MSREELLDYLFNFMPLLHKKMFKDFHGLAVSKQQMHLLFLVERKNGYPMNFYGDKLMISKPNLTTVVNKLIEEKLLERKNDPNDRRVILLYITEKGQKFIMMHKEKVRNNMLKKLESLTDEDINTLNRCFKEMKSILSKLE